MTILNAKRGYPRSVSHLPHLSRGSSGKKVKNPDELAKSVVSSGNRVKNPDELAKSVVSSGKKVKNPDELAKSVVSSGKKAKNPDEVHENRVREKILKLL